MNRYLKKKIKKAFEVPIPDGQVKEQFLRTLPQPHIGMWQFILTQTAYLRKWVLLLSVMILLPALMGVHHINKNNLWNISALIPFLALLAVTENTRSTMYGMYEFEMSSRFSLKSVLLARMSVLGLLDVVIICLLIPLCGVGSNISLLQTGIYIIVPYLFTVNISLWIVRHFNGNEALYGCMSVAVSVSLGNFVIHRIADYIYQFSYIQWWIILLVLLIGKMVQEIYKTIKQTEELAWNS